MKQNKKKTSFLSQRAYYIATAIGLALLVTLMVIYSYQTKNKRELAKQEINLDEVGNEAIQKTETTESSTTEATTALPSQAPTTEQVDTAQTAGSSVLSYDGKRKLAWPVKGNIILPFSMDTTVYFETLDQYKCNPGILIEAKEGQGVSALTKCQVREITKNDEIGKQVILDIGNEYTAIYGQLKEIKVKEGQVLKAGDTIGYVAKPTDYYTLEGSHLYLEMTHKEKPVNPVEYLK
jgi:septal ring factor EnvC (AmiA/AmiB activator)